MPTRQLRSPVYVVHRSNTAVILPIALGVQVGVIPKPDHRALQAVTSVTVTIVSIVPGLVNSNCLENTSQYMFVCFMYVPIGGVRDGTGV